MAAATPEVTVVSFTNGGVPQSVKANTPADIAATLDIGLNGVQIFVDESKVQANHTLRDGDLVSFQKEKVASGI